MTKLKYTIFIMCINAITFWVNAQSFNDTLHLQDVEVSVSPFDLKHTTADVGKKIQNIDTVLQQMYVLNALSDILNYQTSVFVKNYAPGSISSTSIRGGNAQQTIVLWNGININNPMLGQADFSQILTGLFDNISIEYGASSSIWGNNAVNGAIRLENKLSHQNSISFQYRYGSFNTHQFIGKIQKAINRQWEFQISPYYLSSDNHYKIGDSLRLKNASFYMKGICGSVSYQINSHHHLQIHSWYHDGYRQVPNNYIFNQYASSQIDKNWRNVLDYTYSIHQWKVTAKLSYIYDILNYDDTVVNIHSRSNVHTFQTEENMYRDISNHIRVFVGHQWMYHLAFTNNYLGDVHLMRQSIYAGIMHYFKKIKYNIIVRKEWIDKAKIITSSLVELPLSQIPYTGNAGIEFQIHKFISMKLQGALFYRLPTLNDWFWKGSGNTLLKPESGYQYEGGILFKVPIKKWHIEIYSEMTAFNKYTDNWIIWLPGGNGRPVPDNILNVWSRGTETNNYLVIHYKKGKIKIGTSSAYILSQILQSKKSNDASVGKQLIYTPRYHINGYANMSYYNTFLTTTYQYVGYRFITSDNTQWLNPYYVMNVAIGENFHYPKISFTIMAGVNNLFNTSYCVVSQRPMPGRNYFIQLNIQFLQNITNHKNQ